MVNINGMLHSEVLQTLYFTVLVDIDGLIRVWFPTALHTFLFVTTTSEA
jgi:hypothetical protein